MGVKIKYQRNTSFILKGMRVPLFIGAHYFENLINVIANDIINLDNRIKKIIVYSKKTEIYKDCESIGVKLEINKS